LTTIAIVVAVIAVYIGVLGAVLVVVVVERAHSSNSRRCCDGSTGSMNIVGDHSSNNSRKYSSSISYCSRDSSGRNGSNVSRIR
jgi:hypothetical protein